MYQNVLTVSLHFIFRCSVHNSPSKQNVGGSAFGTKRELKLHVKRVHKKETVSLHTCNNSFAARGALQDQLDSHTSIKRHACTLGRHFSTVLGYPDIRPSVCRIQAMKFRHNGMSFALRRCLL